MYKLMERLSKDTKRVSSRIRFMMTDLLDRRSNNWIPRRKEETAKTLDEVKRLEAF
jgi:translation initiation factor 4G